jgi:hypothetical protein
MIKATLLVLCIAFAFVHASNSSNLGSMVTVSGISAGAYFAGQFAVAFSGSVNGAGLVAGGPFFCAQGNVDIALSACMTSPNEIDNSVLVNALNFCVSTLSCDPPAKLASSRVFLFSGTADTIVDQGVVKKNENFFRLFMPEASVSSLYNVPAEHAWVTAGFGSDCSYLGSPYINACKFDLGFSMMNFIYNNQLVTPPRGTIAPVSNLVSFSQKQFTPGRSPPSSISLFDTAYAYFATSCMKSTAGCSLHISFHGCEQTIPDIGMAFVNHSGLNEVAEVNNLIILYPQAIKSPLDPFNPKGCFDWWGYTGVDYASKLGPQMSTVDAMRNHISKSKSMLHAFPQSDM